MRTEDNFVELLKEKRLTAATAESCTGGLIATKIVGVSGASEVFIEGLVTYSNYAKTVRLNVPGDIIQAKGAVSAEVAEAMAKGALLNADIGISVTGIAGPGGGSEEKPVGLVYVGIASKDSVETHKLLFADGERNAIREHAADEALSLAIIFINRHF